MEKVGKVPLNVTTVLPIKPFATVCGSQQWDLVTPPWFCNENFVENCNIHKKNFTRGIIYSVISYKYAGVPIFCNYFYKGVGISL